ncbi:hypothetical protein ARAM_004614 [Aspergillus rambellii]|uniref:DNA mismatch repair protein S5 domain-containing protein n=1 Tax=Aspergillus rambellii TaxID=308745 RepID=A0A0F8U8E7_9EURO|nr:hypothetical protein ARAM_004614 [Aspergillus rambellii]
MPIAALPQTTVRAIGSTSVISDPCSIVKELLDNALDASASSVSIEISQNTVDVIQVKDNGHGIPSPDQGLVCRRSFTSKILTLDDLMKIGGKSLGFRGEALASAAEGSGSLTISTRVETDVVGSALNTQRVAHPVGTTIRLTELFKHIPVRRQTALKSSSKAIVRIRKMIQSYAMSRPQNRLSLKILKANNDNSDWVYAPSQDAGLIDATMKIVGTEVASTCTLKEWPALSGSGSGLCQEDTNPGFRVVALLPNVDADITKFNNLGQYISVDYRPLSTNRGIAQNILKLYKSYLRSAASQGGVLPTLTDPFLCLHMQCPEASYDVNVEPAKDDVLFKDPDVVLSLVEDLFRNTYGERIETIGSDLSVAAKGTTVSPSDGTELRRWGNEPHEHIQRIDDASTVSQRKRTEPVVSLVRQKLPPNRSGNKAWPRTKHVPSEQHTSRRPPTSPNSSSACGPADRTGEPAFRHEASSPMQPQETETAGERRISLRQATQAHASGSFLPSPVSSTNSQSIAGSLANSPTSTRLTPLDRSRRALQDQRRRDRERYGNGALDTWFLKTSQAIRKAATTVGAAAAGDGEEEHSLSLLTQQRFGSVEDGQDSASPENTSESPLEQTLATSDSPQITNESTRDKRQELPVLEKWSARLHSMSNPSQNAELEKALEFENRKRAAIQERRKQVNGLRQNSNNHTNSSPHLSRYLAARAALSSQAEPEPSSRQESINSPGSLQPPLNPGDPRAYLLRLQSHGADARSASSLTRISTNKLPLEKIPQGCELYHIGLRQVAHVSLLSASFSEASKADLYTCGDGMSVDTNAATVDLWGRRLSTLIEGQYRTGQGSQVPRIKFDFSNLAQLSGDIQRDGDSA